MISLMKKQLNKLFIIIQPLQYLQALELKRTECFNTLVVLGANKESQLHNLVKEPGEFDEKDEKSISMVRNIELTPLSKSNL